MIGNDYGFFKYTISIWDGTAKVNVRGLVYGNSFEEAMRNIENWYGSSICAILYLDGLEPCSVYEFSGKEGKK